MGCKTRKYSDGGKVLEREYASGKPTFLKAVASNLGVGDGYGKPKAPKKDYAEVQSITKDARTGKETRSPVKRVDVSNIARGEFQGMIDKRKKALDEV